MTDQDYIAEHAAQCDADEREFHEAGLRALGDAEGHLCNCGQPMSRNPHPESGSPTAVHLYGAEWVCIPCAVLANHRASQNHAAEVKRLTAERDDLRDAYWSESRRNAALTARVAELESGSAFVGEELRSRPERYEHYGFYWAQSSRGGPELELSHTDEASIPECRDWMRAFAYTGPTTATIPSPLPTAGDEADQGWLTPGRKILYAPSSDRYFVGRVRAKPHTLCDGTPVVHLHEMEPAYAEYTGKKGDKAHSVYAAAVCNCQPYREARPAPAEPDSPAEERPSKLRDESWIREAADAEDQHASVCAGDMAPRKPDSPAEGPAKPSGVGERIHKAALDEPCWMHRDGEWTEAKFDPFCPHPQYRRAAEHRKPSCLDGVPAVLCEYKLFGGDSYETWAFDRVVNGFVRAIDVGGCDPEEWHISQLTPIHHDPTDAAAVELATRITHPERPER